MPLISSHGLIALFGVLVIYGIARLARSRNRLPLPPGPRGVPILGNINDLPKPGVPEFQHWAKHKDLYGPISSLKILGNTFIIINDSDIALELLNKHAATNSGRPQGYFSHEIVGWKHTLGFQSHDSTFRLHRKNIAKIASSTTSTKVFSRVQEEEAAHFLVNVLNSPDRLFDHIRKEAGAVILKILYGYTVEPQGSDLLVDLVGQAMHELSEATVPGRWMVDIVPLLKYVPEWFPGAGFKKTGKEWASTLTQAANQPYNFVKQQMQEKKHKVSFLSQGLEESGSDPSMDYIHKWSAFSLYSGGSDTTVVALEAFFLAMMISPDVQKKAREELDRVVGSERLPVAADRERLPYIEAIMKELHRWHNVAPMGIPHTSDEEGVIRGYRIPKGAILLSNTWLITHDPSIYPSPFQFLPERHLDTPTHEAEPDPRTWTFGYGRRVCPGRYIADNALFITIAQVLAVFDIEKPVDEKGATVEPEVKFLPGLVSRPVPYRAVIRPRSKRHEGLIREAEKLYSWDKSDAKLLETVGW